VDAAQDRTAEDVRVAEIRLEIERTRSRIVETIDALEYKADVPARLADVLSATASNVTARVLQRIPTSSRASDEEAAEHAALQVRIRE
jgi:hypothetical protein